ncbi:MAG: hypothetical protein IKA61_01200 [Clostridia bacterium]|nr:hypothetical protein [Clostridia bacterium]
MSKTMYVVSHSHWDREWYLSHAKHNFNLVRTMDKLIEVLENDEGFKSFHLDGQIIVLDDYLAVRPSMRTRVERLITDGKLKVGPFYILQDDYLLSGEANARNVLVGLRETAKYGKPTMIGYFPDTFGNVGQMPQILRGFGIDNAFMGRGTVISSPEKLGTGDEYFSEFKWVAPDGSEVITEQFILWYANGMELPEDLEGLKDRLNALDKAMSKCTKTPCLLLMNGCDHQPVQANLSKVIENAKQLGYDVVHTTFEDFLEKIRPYEGEFAKIKGEINQEESNGFRSLRETASARIYLKQSSYRAGYLLEGVAEPLSMLAEKEGFKYDDEMLHYAWKCLLENYPHDSICGCSVDEVHRKMETRFAETIDTIQSHIDLVGDRLIKKLAKDQKSVLVANLYPKATADYVECRVDFLEGEQIPADPVLVDGKGNRYYPVVEDLGEMMEYSLPEDKFRQVFKIHRFIYRIYGEFAPLSLTLMTVENGEDKAQRALKLGDKSMENSLVRVSFNKNGTFNVLDKQSGKALNDQNSFTEIGDKGNEYEFMPDGKLFDTLSDEAEISVYKVEKDLISYRVINHLMQQNGEPVEIESIVTLHDKQKGVKVSVKLQNTCKDHRIRADFAWSDDFDTHNSSGQYDLTTRANKPGPNWTAPHHPQRTFEFVERINSARDGMILSLRGNNLYEIMESNGHTQITLVRGVGILGDWFDFYTYDSQCLREVTAEYMVEFYTEKDRESAIDSAYAYHHPRLCAFAGNGRGEEQKGFGLEVSGDVTVTCVKMSQKGENVVRMFNPYNEPKSVKFSKEVTVTDMAEIHDGEKLSQTVLTPKKILTVKF